MRFLLLALLLLPLTGQADIYKWTDENGKVHFSDSQQSESAKRIEIETPEPSGRRNYRPATTTQGAANRLRIDRLNRERAQAAKTRNARRNSGPSIACELARSSLARHDRALDNLRKRGYKQWERQQLEDWMDEDHIEIKENC